mgnify:CR=1 FL=1
MRYIFLALALIVGAISGVDRVSAQSPAASWTPPPLRTLTPDRVLGVIRHVFRLHRPPPAYVTYTLVRKQMTNYGYPDYVNSYTYHIWCRTIDRAALERKVFRDDDRGPLEFQRPAFNEDRDPGPPTADVFEPAPVHPHPVEFVPTPEPANTPLPIIGSVVSYGESDYNVASMDVQGGLLHLVLAPRRDPERNRLREIWADKKSFELRKIIAHDRLFIGGTTEIYPVTFTYALGYVQGKLVVTDLHGIVGGNYDGDGQIVDYHFQGIQFPGSLPSWYFDPHTYAMHQADAPS